MWRRTRVILTASVLILPLLPSAAGTLSIGRPVVQNNQYTFPVNLQGNAEGVAALDFRLAYDPAVFSPVSAQIGTSAATAQKQVSSNVAEPGEFIVVMMGFNQNVVEPGTVVQVVLEKIGEPANGQSELLINEPTMATYEGVEINSNGEAHVVKFGDEGGETEEPPAVTPNKEEDRPEPTVDGEPATEPDTQPAGSFKFIVAEPTENKARDLTKSAAAGNSTGNPALPTASGPGGAGPRETTPTTSLPPGSGPEQSAEPREDSMLLAGKISPVNTGDRAEASEASAALVASGGATSAVATAPLDEGSGNRGVLFVTLIAVAFALPLAAFLGLKALRKN